jgi:hypothetical protein
MIPVGAQHEMYVFDLHSLVFSIVLLAEFVFPQTLLSGWGFAFEHYRLGFVPTG